MTGTGFSNNELEDHAWTNTTSNAEDIVYTVEPVSADGCIGNTFNVIVTINPEPVGTLISETVCSDQALGGSFTLTTEATGVPAVSYNITNINIPAGLTASAGSPATGTALSANILEDDAWTNTTGTTLDVIYTVVPNSANGCQGDPFTVTASINPEPVGVELSGILCSDEVLGGSYTLSATGTSVVADSYEITNIENAAGLIPSSGSPSTGIGFNANVLEDDAWSNTSGAQENIIYTIIPVSANGCKGDSFNVTISVDPGPVGISITETVCSDQALGALFTLNTEVTGVAADSYEITGINNPDGLTADAGNAPIAAGLAANVLETDIWTNTSASPADITYTIIPISGDGCEGNPFTVIATINPEPVGVTIAETVCSDQPLGALFTLNTNGTSVAADSYEITSINNPGGLTADPGNASVAAGLNANVLETDIWTNTSNSPADITYTIIPISADGCQGDPFTVTATINPEPVANITSTGTEVCVDDPITLTGTISGGATSGSWRIKSGQPAGANTSGTLSSTTESAGVWSATYTPDGSYTDPVTFEFVAASLGVCADAIQEKTLNIRNLPVVSNQSYTFCENAAGSDEVIQDLTAYNTSITSENQANVNIIWYSNSTLTATIADPTNVAVNNNDVFYAKVEFNGTTCFEVAEVDFRIDPQIVLDAGGGATSSVEICDGDVLDLASIASPPTQLNADNLLWTTTGSGSFDDATALRPVYDPAPDDYTSGPITLRLTGSNAGLCSDAFDEIALTIKQTPVITAIDNISVCSEQLVSIPFTVDVPNPILNISISDPSVVSGGISILGGNLVFTTTINTTGVDKTAVISLSATQNGCTTTKNINLTLQFRPVVSSEPDEPALCSGDQIPPRNFSHDSGTGNFEWEITNSSILADPSVANGSGDFPGLDLAENLSGSEIVSYVRYSSTAAGCVSPVDSFKVSLKPAPVVLNQDVVFYDGDEVNVQFLANTSNNTDFYWENDETTIGINNVQGNTENISGNTITPNGFIATNPFDSEDNIATITVYGITDGCRGPDSQFRIIVKPIPIIDIKYQNICDIKNGVKLDFETTFNDLESDSIVSYTWILPNNPDILVENDTAIFDTFGRKSVRLEVTTALNRTFSYDYFIEIWNVIDVNFEATNVSASSIGEAGTLFAPTIELEPTSTAGIVEFSYDWDFGDPASGINNTSNVREPQHNFETPGQYTVTLTVSTIGVSDGANDICLNTEVNVINIVESVDNFPYQEDFEDGPAGWGSSAASNNTGSSWTYIANNTANYFSNAKNNSSVWGTVLSDEAGFNTDENSYLNAPNFDLSSLDRPMIAFDMWLDVEDQNRAGAIIEYSLDDENWQILGQIGEPLNWYNTITLDAIGGSTSNENQEAWSFHQDEEWQWKRVAYSLDELKSISSTIFIRINFKGNDNENSTGMAIDNFYLGERQKMVLLENFTNLNSRTYFDNRSNIESLSSSDLSSDILPLNFHISIPTPDSINNRNSVQMDARAGLYNISESPRLVIDGQIFEESITNSDRSITSEIRNNISARSLLEPSRLVDINIDENADQNTIRFQASLNPNSDTASTLIAYFFIVEKSIPSNSEFKNIVRQILPNINGVDLNQINETTIETFEWEVNSIYTADDLAVVSLVQERSTNSVLELNITDINQSKISRKILDADASFEENDLELYPNPSRGRVHLKFTRPVQTDLKVMVIDSKGKMIDTIGMAKGNLEAELDLNGLASGVYYIITKTSEGKLNRKKLIILD
jgi:hypothetical protein